MSPKLGRVKKIEWIKLLIPYSQKLILNIRFIKQKCEKTYYFIVYINTKCYNYIIWNYGFEDINLLNKI